MGVSEGEGLGVAVGTTVEDAVGAVRQSGAGHSTGHVQGDVAGVGLKWSGCGARIRLWPRLLDWCAHFHVPRGRRRGGSLQCARPPGLFWPLQCPLKLCLRPGRGDLRCVLMLYLWLPPLPPFNGVLFPILFFRFLLAPRMRRYLSEKKWRLSSSHVCQVVPRDINMRRGRAATSLAPPAAPLVVGICFHKSLCCIGPFALLQLWRLQRCAQPKSPFPISRQSGQISDRSPGGCPSSACSDARSSPQMLGCSSSRGMYGGGGVGGG